MASTEQRVEKMIRENGLARQTAVMNDLKTSVRNITNLGSDDIAGKARQTLLNRSSALPDAKALEGRSLSVHEQDAMVDLIASEVGSWKKDLLDNYMKLAEKAEKELQTADSEKTQLLSVNVRLSHDIQALKTQFKTSLEEREKLELTLQHYMTEYEVQSEQLARVRENYDKYEQLHSNIERTLRAQLAKLTEESEARIAELTAANQRLAAEKAALLKEKNQNASAQITNEEFQKYQADQIAELTLRNSKLALDNEDIRVKNHKLVLENSATLDRVNALQDEIHRLTNEYEMRIDQVTKTYELRLKADVSRKQTEMPQRATERNERFSDLYTLNIPEHDQHEAPAGGDNGFFERERTLTELDRMRLIRGDSTSSQSKVSSLGTSLRTTNAAKPANPSLQPERRGPPLPSGGLSPSDLASLRPGKMDLEQLLAYPEMDETYDVRNTSGPNFLVS